MPDIASPRITHVQYDRYFDVPEDLYQDMLSATSADDYFDANIYGRFRHMQQ